MRAPDILRTLRAIDWDFDVPRSGYVQPPHWYPGTFVPALSDALIEALAPPGGTIFDPYGGVGTTGWSAIRTGRSVRLRDLNPVALLAAHASTVLLQAERLQPGNARSALTALGRNIGRNDDLFALTGGHVDDAWPDALGGFSSSATLLQSIVVGEPRWEALDPWFADETLLTIRAAFESVTALRNPPLRVLGLCLISAVARSLCSQQASWGHIADNVRPKEYKVQSFHAATSRWLKRTLAFATKPMRGSADGGLSADVALRDWSTRNGAGDGAVDLLLTSPPYADAIDYTLSQRLSLYLLGYDDTAIAKLVGSEIGARRKRFKAVSRTDWSSQLSEAMREQITYLKPDGIICLVLPHKDSGRSGGEEELRMTLSSEGWRLFFETDRSIHQAHTRQSWTSIKKETILVFGKESG